MKAFLASTIKHPDSQEALKAFVPNLKTVKMAYVPTAAHAEEGFGVWESGGSWKVAQNLCDNIEIVKLEDYRNNTVLTELQKYDVIWFAGGFCGYLMYWMLQCGISKDLFKDKVYIGISAGSSVAGTSLSYMSIYKDGDSEPASVFLPGLGILDKEFYPHYQESQYERISENYKGEGIYLVPDGEQILIEDDNIKPSEGVTVLD